MSDRPLGKLPELVADLRRNENHLESYIGLLEARFASRESQVRAFVPESGRFERLRKDARELARRHPDPDERPPLYGLPIGVKDVFHVRGFLTRGGSRLPPETLHGLEADAVTGLKKAGALILGKTVSTEFAYFAPGPTRNPRNPDHTPGGSSSGSAAAVGAGLCPLTLGTQTIGSISRPAAYCGVTGYKPSYDRISRAGLIPLAPSFDHVGILGPDVSSCELVASILCHAWKESTADQRPIIGVPTGPYLENATQEGRNHFLRVRERLDAAGFELCEVDVMSNFAEIVERHRRVVAAEASRVHAEWFPRFGELYHEKTAELVREGQKVSSEDLDTALAACRKLRDELMATMRDKGIDLWVCPAAPGAAPRGLESTGDPVMNLPWSQAGLPSLSLPAGRNEAGLPLGLQLVGRWWADSDLCVWGKDVERALR